MRDAKQAGRQERPVPTPPGLRLVAGSNEARGPTARLQFSDKTEMIFDGVGTRIQFGTNNQRALDAKDRVAFQVLIAFEEQMSDEGAKAGRTDHEMDVRGAKGMPSHSRQQLARGTVIRDRIADGQDGLESVETCRIGSKARPQVPLGLVLVLDVIQLIGRGLPDFDQRIRNRLPLGISDTAAHHQRLARLLAKQDTVSLREFTLLAGIERPKDR